MTVEVKAMTDTMICSKCGSRMAFRNRITFSGNMIKIKQCIVCKHYVPISS